MLPVLRKRLDRPFLAVALGVAVAPAGVALPQLLWANRYDWVASMAFLLGASWVVATWLAGRKRWSVTERMVFGSFVLVCSYLVCAIGVELVHGALTDKLFWSQVLSLRGLLSLVFVLGACLLGAAVITVVFGSWLLLPLYPWMLVRERMRSLPTEDAPEAMLLVSGVGAVVESVVLGLARGRLAWMMGLTAAVGLAAVGWAVSRWQRALRIVASYPVLKARTEQVDTRLALRLSSTDDPSLYDTLLTPEPSTTYRHDLRTRALAVPAGADLSLATVLRAWLSPLDGRRVRALVVVNALWLAALGLVAAVYYAIKYLAGSG